MDVYKASQALALKCYKATDGFPSHERFTMVQQVRRAALSVHLNLAEGCARKSKAERRRFFEISRSSVVEIDTCLDLAVKLRYTTVEGLNDLGSSIVRTFQMLSKMIKGE
jgi:four helix bundle protein